jgi:hypothetical protein
MWKKKIYNNDSHNNDCNNRIGYDVNYVDP